MRCNNCGKKVRDDELICPECGSYITGEEWKEEKTTNISPLPEKKEEKKQEKREKVEIEEFRIKDASGTKKNQFYYENEDLLEAYIGEDYKLIKKSPFNIWAFLFNWVYLLYRKLYITGIAGLVISWIFILIFRNYKAILIYIGIVSLLLGIFFSKYYIWVSKQKVEKIKAQEEENGDSDKFTIANTCKENGGVNTTKALIIYLAFLLLIFISLFPISFNTSHNTKFWQENSENLANCTSVAKSAYANILVEDGLGTVEEAVCKVNKSTTKEYEVYLKTVKDNKVIYSYYVTDKGYISLKKRTTFLEELREERKAGTLSEEDQKLLAELEMIEKNYKNYYARALEEEEAIKKKKNKEEKLNYILTKEEIIR